MWNRRQPETPTKAAQIDALLGRKALELAERYVGRISSVADYQRVFTVTLDDILRYVAEQGLPKGAFRSVPDSGDGLYCHEDSGHWVVYQKERGVRQLELGPFTIQEDALAAVATCIAQASGTGIDFRKAADDPARSEGSSIYKPSQSPPPAATPAAEPTNLARLQGVMLAAAAFAVMVVELRWFLHSGTPEASGSSRGNLGKLMLMGLPWLVCAAGIFQIVTGARLRDSQTYFGDLSTGRRVGLSTLVVALLLVATLLASRVS